MSEKVIYTPSKTYETLKNILKANDSLIDKGQLPVSVSIIGEAGIGKTTIVRELAQDSGRGFYKLNLSQFTEPSELIGYYSKEYEVKKGENIEWITENLLPKFVDDGYHPTSGVRTKPCPPDWVVNLKEGSILFLDDFNRSNPLFSQSTMELVNEQSMVGWDLRSKKIQIFLSENPEDGNYNVASMDKAQRDRMLSINMEWSAKDWAERAEKIGTDERLINFVISEEELFSNKKSDGITASGQCSPRMLDKFFSLIGTIDDFEKHIDQITEFGAISVGKTVTAALNNFIKKRYDKLPSIEKLIKEYDLKDAKAELTKACGDYTQESGYKPATSAILTTRLYNYVKHYGNKFTTAEIKQFAELMLHTSFTVDHKYMLVRQTISVSPKMGPILAGDPRFVVYMKNS